MQALRYPKSALARLQMPRVLKLPKRIPYHIAMEMLLTGRWLDTEEAARWGMINHVYPAK